MFAVWPGMFPFTTILNVSLADTPASVAVTVTESVPMSADVGVPEKILVSAS